jgi:hypothetical protein
MSALTRSISALSIKGLRPEHGRRPPFFFRPSFSIFSICASGIKGRICLLVRAFLHRTMPGQKVNIMPSGFFDDKELTLTHALRRALFDQYGPADRRIKKLEKASIFRVDECEIYRGADGKPLSHVCVIFVHVDSETMIKVSLSGNVPLEGPVQDWIRSEDPSLIKHSPGLSFSLSRGQPEKLETLANAIAAIVSSGRRYSTPSFKYTCPRTASALRNLKKVLDKAWK